MRQAISLFAASLCALPAWAENQRHDLPLWEAGVGFGIAHVPHYPGADQSQTLATPFPLFIYRGRTVKSDDSGVRGRLFDSERVALDIGFAFSLPADSEDNDARRGMEDLDLGVEVGPSLNIKLADWGRNFVKLQLPVRALLTTDFGSLDHNGWVFEPTLRWRTHIEKWRFDVSFSTLLADNRYHDYYYEVAPQFVTANRPGYAAAGGYGRTGVRVGALRRNGNWRYGWAASHYTLSGSQVEDSPLVRSKNATYLGAVLLWTFAESKQRAATSTSGILNR